MQSRETQITMVKWTNAGGQTKGAHEQSFVYRPPAWRRWRNVKTTSEGFVKQDGKEQKLECEETLIQIELKRLLNTATLLHSYK